MYLNQRYSLSFRKRIFCLSSDVSISHPMMGTKTWASLKPKLQAATQMHSDPKVKEFGANLDAIENSELFVCKSLQMAEGSHTLKFTMADKEILECPIEATNGYQKFSLEFSLPYLFLQNDALLPDLIRKMRPPIHDILTMSGLVFK